MSNYVLEAQDFVLDGNIFSSSFTIRHAGLSTSLIHQGAN
ncbi:hypothetical protein SLEP1_g12175 [Rubroshorea leprosula]|uniref:Uncharacterized protein n=1 Tax=Rubroshorea leprosula TaxID=152421 RepID=A0AAV5IHF2_9ROSI|nr:hypothetical protein SLEP1_g12175 [Rubroshorea leprosula]